MSSRKQSSVSGAAMTSLQPVQRIHVFKQCLSVMKNLRSAADWQVMQEIAFQKSNFSVHHTGFIFDYDCNKFYLSIQAAFEGRLNILQSSPECAEFALMLTHLGIAQGVLGEYTQAQGSLEKALVIQKRLFEVNSVQAVTLLGLGNIYGWFGDYAKANASLKEALEIHNKQSPVPNYNYLTVALLQTKIGINEGLLGDYSKAQATLKQVLEIQESGREGCSDPNCFMLPCVALGIVEGLLGNNAKGKKILQKALDLAKSYLPEHALVVLASASVNFLETGEHSSETQASIQRAYDSCFNTYGVAHAHTQALKSLKSAFMLQTTLPLTPWYNKTQAIVQAPPTMDDFRQTFGNNSGRTRTYLPS